MMEKFGLIPGPRAIAQTWFSLSAIATAPLLLRMVQYPTWAALACVVSWLGLLAFVAAVAYLARGMTQEERDRGAAKK